ncbi:MAG TPA: hypothetical protein VGX50_08690, partial [Longimicrobium sp.]|nr:hypothetical protein [Longimicrobium sp.]
NLFPPQVIPARISPMEKLRRFGLHLLAWSLFFVAWICAIQGLDHTDDLLFLGFVAVVLIAAGVFILLLDRRSLRKAEQEAHVQRQLDVLRLAEAEGGQLTATQAAARLGWPLGVALTTLLSLEDGVRVTTLVPEEGVRVFEFPEIIHGSGRRNRGTDVPGSALPASTRD